MERSSEIVNLVTRWYEAFTAGNSSFFEGYFSRRPGVLVIGTDPQEWWTDYETIIAKLKAQTSELSGLQITAETVDGYADGKVGWAASRVVIKMPDGTAMPMRHTAVYSKEQGEWRCVQWHVSLGVGNEEALGQELTV